ncbi:MAG: hypothetical protein FWH17_09950, partial [Oscillospiraceae bacterium]|nr:hypothetical protein [Oscillospiraceae bacterium]
QKYFFSKPLHRILPMAGCIPKCMFDPDFGSVVNIKAVLKRGGGILLFPEGRCSYTQKYAGIHKSTGKLIKKLGVPVISSYIEGAATCVPLWRRGIRFGNTRVTHRNLFSASDLDLLSVDEINAAIGAVLSGADGIHSATGRDTPAHHSANFRTCFSRRLAEGLHQLLYYCPVCKSEFTIETLDCEIRCSACGAFAKMNRSGKLESADGFPQYITLWVAEQSRREMSLLSDDMKPISEKVKIKMPSSKPGGGMVQCGEGTLLIDPSGLRYEGTIHDENASLLFPTDLVPAISYDHCNNIHLHHDGKFYMFVPEDTRKCIKYVIITEALHWKFASKPLLTPGVNSGFVIE